jgi:hypothetical protein
MGGWLGVVMIIDNSLMMSFLSDCVLFDNIRTYPIGDILLAPVLLNHSVQLCTCDVASAFIVSVAHS